MAKTKVPSKIKVDLPTPEEKKERTITDIQNEFGALCARAGHLEYQIYTFKKDQELLNGQIRDLNLEAAALQGKTNPPAAEASA